MDFGSPIRVSDAACDEFVGWNRLENHPSNEIVLSVCVSNQSAKHLLMQRKKNIHLVLSISLQHVTYTRFHRIWLPRSFVIQMGICSGTHHCEIYRPQCAYGTYKILQSSLSTVSALLNEIRLFFWKLFLDTHINSNNIHLALSAFLYF